MHITLAKNAYDQIKRDIVTCVYMPGQQIAQPQMVEKYALGITPVREALHKLSQEGFLKPVPRFGYVINTVSIPDVVASKEDLDQLVKNADFSYIPGDRQSTIDFVNNNARFHLSFAIATGNRRLVEAISKMLDEMARIFFLGLNFREMLQESRIEHQAIAKAIFDRDPDKAELTSREEIIHSRDRILEVFRSGGSR